jgi:hypothetical protein
MASPVKARRAVAVPVPVIGVPCPLASTVGWSRASLPIDSPAARRLQVVYQGGPDRPGRRIRSPVNELTFNVTTASPVIRTRSSGRKYDLLLQHGHLLGQPSVLGQQGTRQSD